MMNTGHAALAEWGLTHIKIRDDDFCLDLENTMDVCTSQQEMITLNSQLLLSMRKILYNRETTYTDYVFLNSIKTFLGSISASHPLVDRAW